MIRTTKWLLLAFFLSALSGAETRATTITAASCSQTDVQAAINSAGSGDTVVIPACPGGASWTSTVSVTKGITIQGQGIGQTVLIDNIPKGNTSCSGAGPLLAVNSNTFFRLTGFTLQGSAADTNICQPGHITITGTSQSFRIDHLSFTNQQTVAIRSSGNLWGVIDHSSFQGVHKQGIIVDHGSFAGGSSGDGSWASPSALGSNEFIFIEDDTFTDPQAVGAGAFDVFNGGRVVFRHNTAAFVVGHGTETTGRGRGMRVFEIYNNTFTPVQNSQYTAIYLRSGTGVIHDNAFNDSGGNTYTSIIQAINFRDTSAYAPWGQCNGSSVYDQNASGQSGYACIDQVGRGQGALLSGSTPSPAAWPSQASEPVYQWNNTHNGAGNQMMTSVSSHVQSGRDFIDNVAIPGYTPYPYPHPLTQSTGNPPAAPTTLSAIVN